MNNNKFYSDEELLVILSEYRDKLNITEEEKNHYSCILSDLMIRQFINYKPITIDDFRLKIPLKLREHINHKQVIFLEDVFNILSKGKSCILEEPLSTLKNLRDFNFRNDFISIDKTFENISFNIEESRMIRKPYFAREMESKWNIYFKNNKLFFRRSWTGYYIYICYFKELQDCLILEKIDINRDKDQYIETNNEYDIEFCLYLIDKLLLNKNINSPKRISKKINR